MPSTTTAAWRLTGVQPEAAPAMLQLCIWRRLHGSMSHDMAAPTASALCVTNLLLQPLMATWDGTGVQNGHALLALRRQQRMKELKKAAQQAQRFGSVRDIGRSDFVREVTNAGADVHVVVHLHKDG